MHPWGAHSKDVLNREGWPVPRRSSGFYRAMLPLAGSSSPDLAHWDKGDWFLLSPRRSLTPLATCPPSFGSSQAYTGQHASHPGTGRTQLPSRSTAVPPSAGPPCNRIPPSRRGLFHQWACLNSSYGPFPGPFSPNHILLP